MNNQKFLCRMVHHAQINTTISPEDGADQLPEMLMTKYSLELYTENSESVYQMLTDDLELLNASVVSASGDANDVFRPKVRSELEETKLSESSLLPGPVAPPPAKPIYNGAPRHGQYPISSPHYDVLKQDTSPYPVSQENAAKWNVNGNGLKFILIFFTLYFRLSK